MATTAKGEARRQLLIDAVLRLLEREGPAAITHRAVAAEAGVPLAAATYYFASIDDLMMSALRSATADQNLLFETLARGDFRGFAASLIEWAIDGRLMAIAQYELMFLAMHRPALREDADQWYSALGDAIGELGLPDDRSRVAALALDGLALQMLWRGEPSTVDAAEAAVREILGRPAT